MLWLMMQAQTLTFKNCKVVVAVGTLIPMVWHRSRLVDYSPSWHNWRCIFTLCNKARLQLPRETDFGISRLSCIYILHLTTILFAALNCLLHGGKQGENELTGLTFKSPILCVLDAWSDSKHNHDIFTLLLWAAYKLAQKWKQGMDFNLWMRHNMGICTTLEKWIPYF